MSFRPIMFLSETLTVCASIDLGPCQEQKTFVFGGTGSTSQGALQWHKIYLWAFWEFMFVTSSKDCFKLNLPATITSLNNSDSIACNHLLDWGFIVACSLQQQAVYTGLDAKWWWIQCIGMRGHVAAVVLRPEQVVQNTCMNASGIFLVWTSFSLHIPFSSPLVGKKKLVTPSVVETAHFYILCHVNFVCLLLI